MEVKGGGKGCVVAGIKVGVLCRGVAPCPFVSWRAHDNTGGDDGENRQGGATGEEEDGHSVTRPGGGRRALNKGESVGVGRGWVGGGYESLHERQKVMDGQTDEKMQVDTFRENNHQPAIKGATATKEFVQASEENGKIEGMMLGNGTMEGEIHEKEEGEIYGGGEGEIHRDGKGDIHGRGEGERHRDGKRDIHREGEEVIRWEGVGEIRGEEGGEIHGKGVGEMHWEEAGEMCGEGDGLLAIESGEAVLGRRVAELEAAARFRDWEAACERKHVWTVLNATASNSLEPWFYNMVRERERAREREVR